MRPFSLLVKPASADCNLRCPYCFYLGKSALYPERKRHRMSEEVLEKMIAGYMATEQPVYAFGWQGGEPTLMGLEFFQRATELQKKHGRRGAVVSNGLQTNATCIDDRFARHLSEYRFLVGVSLDGPPEIHDRYRCYAGGRGSHEDVLRTIAVLRRNRVEFNILTLVTDANVGDPAQIYRYLCDQEFLFHQYIPCVEFDAQGRPMPFTISGQAWGDFLCGIYDCWHKGDVRRVSVRLFDSILSYMVEGKRNVCHMGRSCAQYLVVEHNGDVYPCDFFVEPRLKLGNVTSDSWESLHSSATYRVFGSLKSKWNAACAECEYLEFCMGDCLKHRLYGSSDPRQQSWLCTGWKRFYAYALPGLRALANELKRARIARFASDLATRPGRNDPCPCGSGKKYKKCCGQAHG